jgi:hypothetical protein
MNLLEEAVLEYLTHEGDLFVCPQYRATGGNPDFVALNFTQHRVEVVEVSSAYTLTRLNNKLKETAWVDAVYQKLKTTQVIDDSWRLVLRVFVTAAYKPQIKEKDCPHKLEVETIDDVFKRLLDWEKNVRLQALGVPRVRSKRDPRCLDRVG